MHGGVVIGQDVAFRITFDLLDRPAGLVVDDVRLVGVVDHHQRLAIFVEDRFTVGVKILFDVHEFRGYETLAELPGHFVDRRAGRSRRRQIRSEFLAADRPRRSCPGTITKIGKNILGMAPISGVRRAADIDSAAIARCTTRKFVHQ